jgi:hypothetical protein
VFFDNVRVPKSNRLGKEGEGFKIAMKVGVVFFYVKQYLGRMKSEGWNSRALVFLYVYIFCHVCELMPLLFHDDFFSALCKLCFAHDILCNKNQGLDGGRLSIGACSLGAASAALKAAGAYVHEREQFGK